jgi:hypothetical protein
MKKLKKILLALFLINPSWLYAEDIFYHSAITVSDAPLRSLASREENVTSKTKLIIPKGSFIMSARDVSNQGKYGWYQVYYYAEEAYQKKIVTSPLVGGYIERQYLDVIKGRPSIDCKQGDVKISIEHDYFSCSENYNNSYDSCTLDFTLNAKSSCQNNSQIEVECSSDISYKYSRFNSLFWINERKNLKLRIPKKGTTSEKMSMEFDFNPDDEEHIIQAEIDALMCRIK